MQRKNCAPCSVTEHSTLQPQRTSHARPWPREYLTAPNFPRAVHGAQKMVNTRSLKVILANVLHAIESYDMEDKKLRTTCNCKPFMESTVLAALQNTLQRCGDQSWYRSQLVVQNRSGLTGCPPHEDGIFDADVPINQNFVEWLCKWSDDHVGFPIFHSTEQDEATGAYSSVSLTF